MNEADFRVQMQMTLGRIEKALENVDPDVVDCEQSMGSITLTLKDGSRCILSAQPSVRQLWLALAAKGQAFHFNFDGEQWLDDKGQGVELLSYLESYLKDSTSLVVRL